MIALGLVDTREQVKTIVDTVDTDLTEKIEFEEFLSIVKGGPDAKKDEDAKPEDLSETAKIHHFFKDLTQGKMKIPGNENIPFSLFITL